MSVIAAKALKALLSVLTIAVPLPVFVIIGVLTWLHFDKTSAIRQAVDGKVQELVHSSDVARLEAELKAERDKVNANERAAAAYQLALQENEKRQAAAAELREQEIADYERKLAEAGRSCLLDGADLDWLRKP